MDKSQVRFYLLQEAFIKTPPALFLPFWIRCQFLGIFRKCQWIVIWGLIMWEAEFSATLLEYKWMPQCSNCFLSQKRLILRVNFE
jgi:hypothetical protein